ncbi:MAG: CBS domain-containing protein, partial [Halobacteriaceae archaeon]
MARSESNMMDLSAEDIMTTEVRTVAPDEEIGEALLRFAGVDFSGFPVVEDGVVVGI